MAPQLHLQRLYCLLQVNVLFPQLHIFFALSGHHFPAQSLDDTPQLQGVHCALLEDISSVYSMHWTHCQTGQEQALQQDPHQVYALSKTGRFGHTSAQPSSAETTFSHMISIPFSSMEGVGASSSCSMLCTCGRASDFSSYHIGYESQASLSHPQQPRACSQPPCHEETKGDPGRS